jgi:DNA primase
MSIVDEIKQHLDIVEFIATYVPLQKSGRTYKALCPFHTEKTPSFIVFPETQTWRCFGACSTGGDIFSFVMRRENVDFREALEMLAGKAGIELRPLDSAEIEIKGEKDRLRAINLAAAQYYHHLLMNSAQGEPARHYLERRGVTRETMIAFQLGYAPDDWHALEEHLKQAKLAPEDILTAGLTVKSESGAVYDRFRGRLIFPIRDMQGHVIGFGGRVLDDSQPKYLNTPQTPLFDKRSVLYGIDLTHKSIRESGTVIVVEGYMDVIIPYQGGVTNLVACMGTALTEEHLKILKRMTKQLLLALDPDAAGMRAVERGVEAAQKNLERKVVPVLTARGLVRYEEQLNAEIRILVLPEGLDPDELILRDRPRWDQLVAEALPVVEYFTNVVLRETDLSTARGKREAVGRLLPVIAAIDSPVARTHYLQRLAQRVRIDERQLLPELERLRGGPDRVATPERPTGVPAPNTRIASFGLEERCLALLLETPALLPEVLEVAKLSAEAFQDVRNRQVFEALRIFASEHPEWSLEKFAVGLDTELNAHVESLLQTLRVGPPLSPEAAHEDLMKCFTRLRKSYLSRLIHDLRFVLQDAQEQGAQERVRELNAMIEQLTRDYFESDKRSYAATLLGRKKAREGSASSDGIESD